MNSIDPGNISLDYLLENTVTAILSRDYMTEHSVFWDDAELNRDECGYYTVDRDGIRFTGLV